MTRLVWIVRHGERVDNVDAQWQANGAPPRAQWDDPPLSARGLAQAAEVGAHLSGADVPPIRHVFCSPFTRCVQTTQQIVNALAANCPQEQRVALPRVRIEPGLCESLNVCQSPPGFPGTQEIAASFPDLPIDAAYRPFLSADELAKERSNFCCFQRVIRTLQHILANCTGNVLIVSHGSPISGCHFGLTGQLRYVGQCTVSKYRIGVQSGEASQKRQQTDARRKLPRADKSIVIASRTRHNDGTKRRRNTLPGNCTSRARLVRDTDGGCCGSETAAAEHRERLLAHTMVALVEAAQLGGVLGAECLQVGDSTHLSERSNLHDVLCI